ncbi:hypothetical protein Leryth_017853 [Lithospermum erythrorhizon]|nr:hypothetical protein Leryth_017853 [Lithospermum erythrorhizon]
MEVEQEDETRFPYFAAIRRRISPDSSFFAAGNIERELLAKQVALDFTEEEKQHFKKYEDENSSRVFCPIVSCGARLKSLEEFEDHYNARHTAACSVCSRVYPTSRLLSLHVSEAHDSFFQAKVARGFAMYECLVEGCGLKLKSYKSRERHLVDKHNFPASFKFFKKAPPSKKQRMKSQRKQASGRAEETSNNMQVEDDTMEGLVTAVSKLSTSESPSEVSFGRHRNRGLTFVPRAIQRERRDPH